MPTNSAMDSEIMGDYSNIKGTDYHFWYTFWLLLCGNATEVAFYRGNDIYAKQTLPPREDSSEELAQTYFLIKEPQISTNASGEIHGDIDIWVQLKATEANWTANELIKKVLKNFLLNVLYSRLRQKKWVVRLVTQGQVGKKNITDFITNPTKTPDAYKNFTDVLKDVKKRWESENSTQDKLDNQDLEKLALEILEKLSSTRPVPLRSLIAETERELTFIYPDRQVVRDNMRKLQGALLEDAGKDPKEHPPRNYDIDWLCEVLGDDIRLNKLFDSNPIEACLEASKKAFPSNWSEANMVIRQDVNTAVSAFLADTKSTLFVLGGEAGSGKYWALTQLTEGFLSGNLRLLIKSSELKNIGSLESLIGTKLREYTSVSSSDPIILRKFLTAAKSQPNPIVLLINDLPTDMQTVENFARILDDCHKQRQPIKVIVGSTLQNWVLSEPMLIQQLPFASSFIYQSPKKDRSQKNLGTANLYSNTDTNGANSAKDSKIQNLYEGQDLLANISLQLGNFTRSELEQVLNKRASSGHEQELEIVLRKLEEPAFSVLRNPYMLTLALKSFSSANSLGESFFSVSINELLEKRVQSIIQAAASSFRISRKEMETAFWELVNLFLEARPEGISWKAFKAWADDNPGLSHVDRTRLELGSLGLLSLDNLRVADNILENYVFAKCIAREANGDEIEIVNQLRPKVDSGLVPMLLRDEVIRDKIRFAERLVALNYDDLWKGAVIDGLKQSYKNDYPTAAMLLSLTRPPRYTDGLIDQSACDAMGNIIATPSKYLILEQKATKKWFIAGYFNYDSNENLRAAYMLASAAKHEPKLVIAAVYLRLLKLKKLKSNKDLKPKQLQKHVSRVLLPLTGLTAPLSKSFTRRLERMLALYGGIVELPTLSLESKSFFDYNQVRGYITHALGLDQIIKIEEDLASPKLETRAGAALALRAIAEQNPSSVALLLCTALEREEEPVVLQRLLWAVYPLISKMEIVQELLQALQKSQVVKWNDVPKVIKTASMTLSLLGNFPSKYANDIYQLLPKDLSSYNLSEKAVLAEMLVYALWRCAEKVPAAKIYLETFITPDFGDLDDSQNNIPNRTLILKSAATALLAKICLEFRISSLALEGYQLFYSPHYLDILYLRADAFLTEHATQIVKSSRCEELMDLLLQIIKEVNKSQAYGFNQFYQVYEEQSFLMLAELITALERPIAWLKTLEKLKPHTMLYCLYKLTERMSLDNELLAYLEAVSSNSGYAGMYSTNEYWHLCKTALAKVKGTKLPTTTDQTAINNTPSFYGSLAGQIQLIDMQSDSILEMVEEFTKQREKLFGFLDVEQETRKWTNLLIARVYTRMFDISPITVFEAKEICNQLLSAIAPLPDSAIKSNYHSIYSSVLTWLQGSYNETPTAQLPQFSEQSYIGASHNLARELLDQAENYLQQNKEELIKWLRTSLLNSAGWWETENYKLKYGTVTEGMGIYFLYCFPVVRLAAIAITNRFGLKEDVASEIMKQRYELFHQIKSYKDDIKFIEKYDKDYQDKWQKGLEKVIVEHPDYEQAYAILGWGLLLLSKLDEAQSYLETAVSLPALSQVTKLEALYNLACVYARDGNSEKCKLTLEQYSEISSLPIPHMLQDADFTSLQDTDWFQKMTRGETQ